MTKVMDITFHYPPELFNLLVDTIPLLNRSYDDVLLFFRGAGVTVDLLSDLERRVRVDRANINKYEIVRTVLTRLNERGEATLRERREVLRRVVEFENYAACWPDDRVPAKGFVAEIREVVNVKDSFTRMNLERKKEKKKRQEEYLARLRKAEAKKAELAKIKEELFTLFSEENPQKRGKQLEAVLNRLFRAYDISVSEAFTIKEPGKGIIAQIDGAIEVGGHLYLVEMKWWKEPLGKTEVSPHITDIFVRGHAGGMLISASGFTEGALTVYRDALPHKVAFLCELEEIVSLLEQNHDLNSFLKEKIQAATIHKNPLYKPLEYG